LFAAVHGGEVGSVGEGLGEGLGLGVTQAASSRV
jgi:hypothetical protein